MPENKTGHGKRVLRNIFFSNSSIFINRFTSFLFSIMIARLLEPDLFGLYYLTLAVGFVFISLTDFGIENTITRWISYYEGRGKRILSRSYLRYMLKIKIILCSAFSLGMFLLAEPLAIYIFNNPMLVIPLKWTSLFVFLESLATTTTSIFAGLNNFKMLVVKETVSQVLKLILVPAMIIAGFSVTGAVIGLSVSSLVTICIMAFFLLRMNADLVMGRTKPVDTGRIKKYVSFLSLSTLALLSFSWIDTLLIGVFLPISNVGFYRIASTLAVSVAGLMSIVSALLPVLTQMGRKKFMIAYHTAMKYSLIIAVPAAFGMALLGSRIVNLFYGPEYSQAALPLTILSFIIIDYTLSNLLSVILQSKELPKYIAVSVIVSSIVSISLNFLLITMFGMLGAAVAIIISRYLYMSMLFYFSWKRLGIRPNWDYVIKPVLASIAMAAFLLLLPPAPADGLYLPVSLFGEMAASVLVYFGVLYALKGVSKKDVAYFRSLAKR